MAPSILVPRIILGTIVFTALLVPSLYDPLLTSIYKCLYSSSLYRFSGFETLQTVFCYAVAEILYIIKFIKNPHLRLDNRAKSEVDPNSDVRCPKRPHMRPPSRRKLEILTYITPLLALDFTLVKKYAGVPVAAIRQTGGYESLVVDINDTISPSFLLPTFHNFSLSSPLQLYRALPEEAPSIRRLLLELALSFFIYDALFFVAHLAFHRIPFLARFHQPHHRHGEMNPQVTNQLSVVERLSLVLLANFALNIIKCHVLTRSAFVPIFVYLLVEIHSGLELEWGYDKLLPLRLGAGARKHAKHHREGRGEYEPFFSWWDRGLELIEDHTQNSASRPAVHR